MTEQLPKGWAYARLSDIAGLNPALTKEVSDDTYVSFVPMAAVEEMTGLLDPSARRPWSEVRKGFTRFQEGDVVLAKITPSMENGKAALALGLHNGVAAGTTELHVVRPRSGIDGHFLLHYLLQESFRRRARARMTGTAGQLRVPEAFLRDEALPVAPSGEQRRIVEAIETYFSRLDAAVASLTQAQTRLRAYRASVLKAAVEGRLVPTEAELARAEGRDYEPADVLLKRVLAEARRSLRVHESNQAKTDNAGSGHLPEGWAWARVGQLAEVTGGLTKNSARDALPQKLPYLRVANVYADRLVLDEIKQIGVSDGELSRALLNTHDLLVVEGNGSVDQIGRVALWDGSIWPILHQNHLIKARFAMPETARWALTWLLSPGGRAVIENVASSTAGLHTLSISKVQKLPVPLPPAAEQERILQAIDQASSVLEASSVGVAHNAKRCQRLKQAVLKSAFEGKLVDQDPTDESAEKLLERIRAERTSATSAERKPAQRRKAIR